ncbi:MBL fold metallo-hydrolase [Azohydromonas sp. G-1-1-14]|uniref:MBL fold metallo-hydrolase n=1 Tax=Azohydromonas caseinilytica TaxID=2728836 RepID=A0A848FD34_9BURK|nr:MBL fold metallo-hydrolase [Azohydromonas caseinilytica]
MSEVQTLPPRPRPAAPLEYPVEAPAPDGSVVEVAPGVLWARMPMPMGLDHVNVYLLRAPQGWTLVDTGLNSDTTRALWEHIERHHLDGLPVQALVCTHWHYDHAGLAHWLTERHGVPLYMTHGEYYTMHAHASRPLEPLPAARQSFYQRSGMPAERVERMFAGLRRDPFMPPMPGAFRRLRAGGVLDIGTRRWRVVIGEGHSPEHACLYSAEDRILLAGDQLLPRISSNVLVTDTEPDADPLQLWFESLARLEQLAPGTLVLPSHHGVFRGLHARTRELRDHHERQFDRLRGLVREQGACTAHEAMLALFPRLRGPVDDMLALGEATAHLSWLRHAGELVRVLDPDGIYRFGMPA